LSENKIKIINYICCPNGFGHFRRFYFLNKLLEKNKIKVNLYSKLSNWKEFSLYFKHDFKNINFFHVDNLPSNSLLTQQQKKIIIKDICKRMDDSLLISDNYEEVINYKNNVILIANFLWGINKKKINYLESLSKRLKNKHIYIYGNKYLSPTYLSTLNNFKGVGFFGPEKPYVKTVRVKKNVLFVKGFGSNQDNFEKIIEYFSNNLDNKYNLFFDKNFLFARKLKLKIVNKFNNNLFNSIDVIVGRPSFGIVTEALSRKIPFLPLSDIRDEESIDTKNKIFEIFDYNEDINEYIKASKKIYTNFNFKFNEEDELLNKILEFIGK